MSSSSKDKYDIILEQAIDDFFSKKEKTIHDKPRDENIKTQNQRQLGNGPSLSSHTSPDKDAGK